MDALQQDDGRTRDEAPVDAAPTGKTPLAEAVPAEAALSPAPIADAAGKAVRVAWVAGERTLDRYGRILGPLAVGLLDEMVDLWAVCPRDANLSQLPAPPMQIIKRPYRPWWAYWRARPQFLALAERLRTGKVQLLHALDSSAVPLTVRLSAATGIRYVISCYDSLCGKLDARAWGLLAASAKIQHDLRRRHLLPASKVHLLRPGVYRARHATCFTEPQYSMTLVAGGQLDDLKAYAAVIRAFADLTARKYDCAYFIVASGPAERALRELSEKLAMHRELTFSECPKSSQLPGIFKAADIYISPAANGSLDVTALLAMAAGVPVVASSPGVSDFIVDRQTALLFKRGNTADLTAKLVALLEDKAMARSLAERALAHLHQHHSPAETVGALARIYRAAIANDKTVYVPAEKKEG